VLAAIWNVLLAEPFAVRFDRSKVPADCVKLPLTVILLLSDKVPPLLFIVTLLKAVPSTV
jgi:hypothetical protein